jgi:hypothetical protein
VRKALEWLLGPSRFVWPLAYLSPEQLVNEQIQQYLVYLIRRRKLSWSSCNVDFSGLQCFYHKFLKPTNNRASSTVPAR